MDDLKASMTSIRTAEKIHETVKRYASSVGMVVNKKKSAIQLNVETPLPESIQEIPRMDEETCRYLGFEMKKGEVDMKEMMERLEEMIQENWRSRRRELKSSRPETGYSSSTRTR